MRRVVGTNEEMRSVGNDGQEIESGGAQEQCGNELPVLGWRSGGMVSVR